MLFTFGLTVFAWIFFRAESMGHAFSYISGIFSPSLFSIPQDTPGKATLTVIMIVIFMVIEWLGREDQFAIQKLGLKWKRPLRYAMYYAMILAIIWFGGEEQQFIYFQF